MKTNWPKIWREFQKAYDKKCCDWPGQKKMIKNIVDSHYFENDINWKYVWQAFDKWCETCPTCGQKCKDGYDPHTYWEGEEGQEAKLQQLLKEELKGYKDIKRRKVSA